MKQKCVVVFSGGLDSTTAALWAKKQRYEVYAITFNYGQIASKETQSAQKIAKNLNVHIKVVDVSSLKDIFGEVTSLCNPNIPMTSTFSDPIIVPFRNAIFLSIAVSYAASIGALKIFYGAHGSDEPFYPDCRKEFYKAVEKAARLGTDKQITIAAPFSGKSKAEIVKIGQKYNVPFELTWSCYFSHAKHCGKCESCSNRKRAFREAKVPDPTEYEE